MRIGITGTTAGIGKAILQLPHEFIEFNRIDGNIHDVEEVYEKLKDCDVFINNAWEDDCQTKLLKYFFNNWKDQAKKIISIGSSVSIYKPSSDGYNHYVDLKRELRTAQDKPTTHRPDQDCRTTNRRALMTISTSRSRSACPPLRWARWIKS